MRYRSGSTGLGSGFSGAASCLISQSQTDRRIGSGIRVAGNRGAYIQIGLFWTSSGRQVVKRPMRGCSARGVAQIAAEMSGDLPLAKCVVDEVAAIASTPGVVVSVKFGVELAFHVGE